MRRLPNNLELYARAVKRWPQLNYTNDSAVPFGRVLNQAVPSFTIPKSSSISFGTVWSSRRQSVAFFQHAAMAEIAAYILFSFLACCLVYLFWRWLLGRSLQAPKQLSNDAFINSAGSSSAPVPPKKRATPPPPPAPKKKAQPLSVLGKSLTMKAEQSQCSQDESGGKICRAKTEPLAPAWQQPQVPSGWTPERVVNWQPLRKKSLNGSVWEQVHDSLEGGANPPPDSLLQRFMRKAAQALPKGRDRANSSKVPAERGPVKRLLPQQKCLTADINHALLLRKGVHSIEQLAWIMGPRSNSGSGTAEPLSDDILEALLGLLEAAAGEEARLGEAAAGSNGSEVTISTIAPTDLFLGRMLQVAALETLKSRMEMSLQMSRLRGKAGELEMELRVALNAVWSVIGSEALPALLEGVLLLGNYVNAGSRRLGGAAGVTLESLTKLRNTRCLPLEDATKRPKTPQGKNENALVVIVSHLDESRPNFRDQLASDLDSCHAARDFDMVAVAENVKCLASQLCKIEHHECSPDEPEALNPARLQEFLGQATPLVQNLKELVAQLEEATAALRQWFAEPPTSSLTEMLKQLAELREALPTGKPAVPKFVERPASLRRVSAPEAASSEGCNAKMKESKEIEKSTAGLAPAAAAQLSLSPAVEASAATPATAPATTVRTNATHTPAASPAPAAASEKKDLFGIRAGAAALFGRSNPTAAKAAGVEATPEAATSEDDDLYVAM
jgi:hypothetical protein